MGHFGSDDFTGAGREGWEGGGEKWQARRQGGELPVDEALEDVGCYIKLN